MALRRLDPQERKHIRVQETPRPTLRGVSRGRDGRVTHPVCSHGSLRLYSGEPRSARHGETMRQRLHPRA